MRHDSQQGRVSQIIWVQNHESVSTVIYTRGQPQNVPQHQGDHVLWRVMVSWCGFLKAQRGSTEKQQPWGFSSTALWPVGEAFHLHLSQSGLVLTPLYLGLSQEGADSKIKVTKDLQFSVSVNCRKGPKGRDLAEEGRISLLSTRHWLCLGHGSS